MLRASWHRLRPVAVPAFSTHATNYLTSALAARCICRQTVQMNATHVQTLELPQSAVRPKAYVRNKAEEPNITICLEIAGRQRNLNRPKDEPLEKPLGRLRANAAPPPAKKDKRKKRKDQGDEADQSEMAQPALPELMIGLYLDAEATSSPLDTALPNEQAWHQARVLRVGDVLYDIIVNPPTVEKVLLHRLPMVGYPLLPIAQLYFADSESSTWRWLRRQPQAQQGEAGWEDTGCRERCYTPCAEDLHCFLRADCTPGGMQEGQLITGEPVGAETGPVLAAPPQTSRSIRQPQPLPPCERPGFRILTYNILADQYAGMAYTQKVLFTYCSLAHLDPDYRKQLVLAELAGYEADVICLQEVDEKAFNDYLQPHMARAGYDGAYTNKMGAVVEGCAMFWRTSRFTRIASKDVLLRKSFAVPLPELHARFQPMLDSSPTLTAALQKVTTIGQAIVLAPTGPAHPDERPLCVINTHLFFHPMACHIRNMHTAAILAEVAQFLDTQLPAGCPRPSVAFCGDLNSGLNDAVPGVVELLREGRLSAAYWDWMNSVSFRFELDEDGAGQDGEDGSGQPSASASGQGEDGASDGLKVQLPLQHDTIPHGDGHDFEREEDAPHSRVVVTGVDVDIPFKFTPADGLSTPFTNYTSGFKSTLDYVWIEGDALEVTRQLAMPTEEECQGFLPNATFPSDHLALGFDVRWRSRSS